jgi:hypothetical protein
MNSKCPCCENTYTEAQIQSEEVVPCNKCYKCFVGDCGNTNCDCYDDDDDEYDDDEDEDPKTKPCSCGCEVIGGSCEKGVAIDNGEYDDDEDEYMEEDMGECPKCDCAVKRKDLAWRIGYYLDICANCDCDDDDEEEERGQT